MHSSNYYSALLHHIVNRWSMLHLALNRNDNGRNILNVDRGSHGWRSVTKKTLLHYWIGKLKGFGGYSFVILSTSLSFLRFAQQQHLCRRNEKKANYKGKQQQRNQRKYENFFVQYVSDIVDCFDFSVELCVGRTFFLFFLFFLVQWISIIHQKRLPQSYNF